MPLALPPLPDQWDRSAVQGVIDEIAKRFPVAAVDIGAGQVTDAKLVTRTVRGGVTATAGVSFGTGFTVARTGGGSANGDYTVTFSPAFSSTPAIALGLGPVSVTSRIIKMLTQSASAFRVLISDAGVTANFDEPFNFIAMSP